MQRVSLIVLRGSHVRFAKYASLDEDDMIRERHLKLPFITFGTDEAYTLVKAEHLCTQRGTKTPLIFIDGNEKCSIHPVVATSLDAKEQNKYKYLAQASFWKGFKGYRVNWFERLLLLFGGMGLIYLIKIALVTRGVTIPF